jgi:hypothetical protein
MHSYHIFYFPFKWEIPDKKNLLFSEQVDINRIECSTYSQWERRQLSSEENIFNDATSKDCLEAKNLFAEQQYYFDFVHPVLYDMKDVEYSMIHHYERKEFNSGDNNVEYIIECKNRTYTLAIDAIDLNIYSTGIGVLSFYLLNERDDQKDELSVRNINQFGRRIMPPNAYEFNQDSRSLIANGISIKGLTHVDADRYSDCFDYDINHNINGFGLTDTWTPSTFILALIEDLNQALKIIPILDDRMLVNCSFINKKLGDLVKKTDPDSDFKNSKFWYQYLYVDDGYNSTCQNADLHKKLVENNSYLRWTNYGTIYGISRYSLVALFNEYNFPVEHMRTIYSRMFELAIVQRASILRFSGEVTKVSSLKGVNNRDIALRIGSLYKEYIRFINQVYFRSITSQDQGIEMYNMMMLQLDCKEHAKELDQEINELHQYVSLLIEQRRSENGEFLNAIAAIFIPATILTGIFGMNHFPCGSKIIDMIIQLGVVIACSIIIYIILKKWRNKNG